MSVHRHSAGSEVMAVTVTLLTAEVALVSSVIRGLIGVTALATMCHWWWW